MYMVLLHIFRRDFRIVDNTALSQALNAGTVLPCFILDPAQLKPHQYQSRFGLSFMIESLRDLDAQLQSKGSKLYLFQGNPAEIVEQLITEHDVSHVYFNRDYTPYSKKRDAAIEKICKKHGIALSTFHDCTLLSPDAVLKRDGTPYTIFTPYHKAALHIDIPKNSSKQKKADGTFFTGKSRRAVPLAYLDSLYTNNDAAAVSGGRAQALRIISMLDRLKNYAAVRDYPAENGTSYLSAHHKFGTISLRETYWHAHALLGPFHPFIRQLYWHSFFTQISYHFPHIYGNAFQKKYQHIVWDGNAKHFAAWCEGKTGFPIIDAGMRELNTTGYMHNRVRMIVASFLTKDLHIDWRKGERYFATRLLDYDPAINNGSWQWAASTGCDAQPYFRIFNPWRQQEKFDSNAEYIKRWIAELREIPAAALHKLHESRPLNMPATYPMPIITHAIEKEKAIARYKQQPA